MFCNVILVLVYNVFTHHVKIYFLSVTDTGVELVLINFFLALQIN